MNYFFGGIGDFINGFLEMVPNLYGAGIIVAVLMWIVVVGAFMVGIARLMDYIMEWL